MRINIAIVCTTQKLDQEAHEIFGCMDLRNFISTHKVLEGEFVPVWTGSETSRGSAVGIIMIGPTVPK